MLLNGGQLEGQRILGRKMVEAMQVNQLADPADPFNQFREAYGYRHDALRHRPHERIIALVLTQHLSFDQHWLFTRFNTLFYSAMD